MSCDSLGNVRNAHDRAQGEQHEEAVPHGESCTRVPWQVPLEDAQKQKRKENYVRFNVCCPCLGVGKYSGILAAMGVEVSMYALGKVGEGLLASAKNPMWFALQGSK